MALKALVGRDVAFALTVFAVLSLLGGFASGLAQWLGLTVALIVSGLAVSLALFTVIWISSRPPRE
jgi:hypothetical protein